MTTTLMLGGTLASLATALVAPEVPERIYVSPAGHDAWSGALEEPNAGGTDGPLRTIAAAKSAVRGARELGGAGPVEVIIRAGTYYLDEPLVFGPEDSGTAEAPITYTAADGEEVIVSGGIPVPGWRIRADGIWGAAPPAGLDDPANLRLLRVGEKWAIRARHPNYDPDHPYTGGWLFADYGGEPWERGALNVAVSNTHNQGTRLSWEVRVPNGGRYHVWLRYAHNMEAFGVPDMSGRTVLRVGDGPPVPLAGLPDTGGWGNFRWAHVCDLELAPGPNTIVWENIQGGGLQLDAMALCEDPGWDPVASVGEPAWWGAFSVEMPTSGKFLTIVQCEACTAAEGAELSVPRPTPPGSMTHVTFREGGIPAWEDPTGAEVHIFIAWGWVNAIVPVERIDYASRRLVFPENAATQDVRMGNRFFVENVREALDAPGEWVWDRATGELLYIPERPGATEEPIVAPRHDSLIRLAGDAGADRFVEHIRFRGLTFRDTTYSLTRDYYTPQDAAIVMSGARDCIVEDCEFAWLGGYALKLMNRSERCVFKRNHVHHVGQGGVIAVGGTVEQSHHCEVLGNTIEHIGLIYKHVAGVYVCHGSDHRIAHNRIADVPRYGISFKSQGEERLSHRNVAEFNELVRCNLETNDTGAFESLGYEKRDSGNVVRYNLILDSVGMGTTPDGEILTPYFTWGIYLDDYSSGTTVYGNIVARTTIGGVCIHGGQNNDIRNNVFVDASEQQVRLQPRDDFMAGNRFVNNIVAYRRPEAELVYCWRSADGLFSEWDRNLYWLRGADLTALPHRITPAGTWADWLTAGFDANSVVADPLFVDPDNDDYRLIGESPAFALGFERIPVERIGPGGLED